MRPPHSLIALLLVLVVASTTVVASDGLTTIEHQGDEIILDAAQNQQIRGTTPFEQGTVIGVRVKSVGDTHPFLVSKAVRVDENGSFTVVFDLSGLAPLRGGPVDVVVRHNQSTIHELDGRLVTENMPENSTLTYDPSNPETTATTSPETVTSTTTTTASGPLSGVTVPGLGITTGVVATLVVALLARR
ncbi:MULTISPECIES: BGTF surface domain-containing protein [Haloferax]|uniref:PGF-CTERM sorting domain-containing protein n=1 Tax=Haloferax marinum TaxID=2666143 RepID=A0A6A8G4G3_9EURY|nr:MULTISPECIES: BGTF surface domain-containing protein [Haloferax]KAB1196678.1 hypothetical protein Hfx1150_03750 [Haloferax sp. CBA1150]MRW95685.1 hypothetical protein [Haloferax marinum]